MVWSRLEDHGFENASIVGLSFILKELTYQAADRTISDRVRAHSLVRGVHDVADEALERLALHERLVELGVVFQEVPHHLVNVEVVGQAFRPIG